MKTTRVRKFFLPCPSLPCNRLDIYQECDSALRAASLFSSKCTPVKELRKMQHGRKGKPRAVRCTTEC